MSNHSNEKIEIVLQHKVGEDLIESVTVLVVPLLQYPIYDNLYPIFQSRWLRTILLFFYLPGKGIYLFILAGISYAVASQMQVSVPH